MASAFATLPQITGAPLAIGRIGRPAGPPGVTLHERAAGSAALIIARKGQAASVATHLSECVAAPIGDVQKRWAKGDVSIAGVAPGQWLLIDRAEPSTRVAGLAHALSGLASVSDQGSGRLVLEVSGPDVRRALAKGIAVDLDPATFPVGSSAQTATAHIGVGIALIDDRPCFEIVSALSTRRSLLTWLLASAAEFGLEIV